MNWEYDLSKAVPRQDYIVALRLGNHTTMCVSGCYYDDCDDCWIHGGEMEELMGTVYAFAPLLPEPPPMPGEEVKG